MITLVPIPFSDCHEEDRFGGKVVSLGEASRAGLPVPPGFGLEVELVNAIVAQEPHAIEHVVTAFNGMQTHVAVRSSAVGEDSSDASFAGQHDSIMNVTEPDGVIAAIVDVYRSAHTESAYAYRQKVGVTADARIAVAMQAQIPSEKAGVMFTRNPINGSEERYIEVAWGLGEAVVAGMVVPDTYRMSPKGEVLEKQIGEKDVRLELPPSGPGTLEVDVEEDLVEAPCLSDHELKELHDLAADCEQAYGSGLDMEFAFYKGGLYLLQCRKITVVHKL